MSRYQDLFFETGFIAAGGFGSVYKAVHKLDEVEYAIKKVIFPLCKVKPMLYSLREVRSFAKLNHTNIVSYKNAWIESITSSSCSSSFCNRHDVSSDSKNNVDRIGKTKVVYSNSSSNKVEVNSLDIITEHSQNEIISNSNLKPILNEESSGSDFICFTEHSSDSKGDEKSGEKVCEISIQSDSTKSGKSYSSETDKSSSNEFNIKIITENSSNDESDSTNQKICQYIKSHPVRIQ